MDPCADPTSAATPCSRSTSATSPGARSTSNWRRRRRSRASSPRAPTPSSTRSTRRSRGFRVAGSLDRIAALERSIMRVALHEMRHGVPVEVAIDEAVNAGEGVLRHGRPGLRQRDPRLGRARAPGGALVSSEAVGRVRELAARLGELSERLRDPEVGDSEAAELAREAAELVEPGRQRGRAGARGPGPGRELNAGGGGVPGRPARAGRGLSRPDLVLRAPRDRGPRRCDALLAARRRQADPAGALPGRRPFGRNRPGPGAARRGGDRAHPHLLADPRRPAGDGRRRAAPRAPDLARRPRRGRRDPRRRRAVRGGDPALLRAPARASPSGCWRRSASSPARPGSTGWSAASTST